MVIVVSVQYKDGFLPDIVLLTHKVTNTIWGTHLNVMKKFVFTAYETTILNT